MAQKAIGPSLGRKRPWGASGRRERRKHASSYLMQSFAYFTKPIRFLETHDPYSTPPMQHGPPRSMSFRPPKPFGKRPRRHPPAAAHFRLWRRSPPRRSVPA